MGLPKSIQEWIILLLLIMLFYSFITVIKLKKSMGRFQKYMEANNRVANRHHNMIHKLMIKINTK